MKRKVLCVCIGGTVRSVGIKDVLNGNHGCDALAASAIWQSPDTMWMLCTWADLIVPVEPRSLPKGPRQYEKQWMECAMWEREFAAKRKVLDLGPDVWGNARDAALQQIIHARIKEIL